MQKQCPNCNKQGKDRQEITSRGCHCNTVPISIIDESDRLDIGNIGSYQRQQGNKIIKTELVGKNIKRLRPLCQHDGVAYIQTHIPVKKTIMRKTRDDVDDNEIEQIHHTTIPYFINSNKELISSESPTLQEDFQMPIVINGLVPRWEIDDLLDFIYYGNDDDNDVHLDVSRLYQAINSSLRRYIDLKSSNYHTVITLWAIGTYFSTLFSYYPYLDFFGTKGSAKSKILKLLEQIVFNGTWFNNISGASAIRSIESLHCTLLLDETENLKNPKSDEAQFLLKFLKGAFATDAKIMINQQTKDGWMPYPFDAGTCVAMGHINGIDDVLEDRTIPIPMQTTLNKNIAKQDIDKEDYSWQDVRNRCYRLYLAHFDEVRELSKLPYDFTILSNRELNQIWKPIITLARFFEKHGMENLVKQVEEVIMESHTRKKLVNQTSNLDVQILEHVVAYVTSEPKIMAIQNQKDWYRQEDIFKRLQTEEGLSWIQSSRLIGDSLDKLGFTRKKNKIGKVIQIDIPTLEIACRRHLVDFPSSASLPSPQAQILDAYDDVSDAGDANSLENGSNVKENTSSHGNSDASDAGDVTKTIVSPSPSSTSPDKKTHYMCFTCNQKGTEPFPLGKKTSNGLTEKDHASHKIVLLNENELKDVQHYETHGGLKPDVLCNR